MTLEQAFIESLPQFGFAAVFLIMVGVLWKVLREKDKQIKETHEKVLDAFQKNTEVTEGVKSTVEQNTEVMKTLSERVYQVLIHDK